MIEFYSNQAHFILSESKHVSRAGVKGETTRWLVFKIGHSPKHTYLKDETFNDHALELLQWSTDKRLAIKGRFVPGGYIHWGKLTHFGIYHRKTEEVYNPNTGELGFYELRTDK